MSEGTVYYHLYLTSSREIKEGDWFRCASSIKKCVRIDFYRAGLSSLYDEKGAEWFSDDSQKIEAATDKGLGVPLIPRSFVEQWASTQGKIDQVKIKMNWYWSADKPEDKWLGPEIASNETEVIILPTKDSWNREGVKDIYEQYRKYYMSSKANNLPFDEWFDKKY